MRFGASEGRTPNQPAASQAPDGLRSRNLKLSDPITMLIKHLRNPVMEIDGIGFHQGGIHERIVDGNVNIQHPYTDYPFMNGKRHWPEAQHIEHATGQTTKPK